MAALIITVIILRNVNFYTINNTFLTVFIKRLHSHKTDSGQIQNFTKLPFFPFIRNSLYIKAMLRMLHNMEFVWINLLRPGYIVTQCDTFWYNCL